MRILIMEDDKKISETLRKGLEAVCFCVDASADGEKGLSLARVNDYDLLILDDSLPKKTGIEICRELRAKGKSLPILVLSVKSEITPKVEYLNAGADDYLTKPFAFDELLARLRALLRRPKEITSEVLVNGSLVLDAYQHTVRYGSQEIYLSRKEFMLLQYLMRNPGILITRGMLMDHVWDMNTDPFSNTIESHLVSLRKKIQCPGRPEFIKTIPGRGYRFQAPPPACAA